MIGARTARALLAAALVLVLASACSRSFDGSSIPYGYLTVKDVEGATGITGVRLDKDSSGAYVFVENATNRKLAQIRTGTDDDFARWKSAPSAMRAAIPGLGKDAYQGPVEGRDPTIIALTKGDHALEIAAMPDMLGASISFDQLYRLAAIAAGRM